MPYKNGMVSGPKTAFKFLKNVQRYTKSGLNAAAKNAILFSPKTRAFSARQAPETKLQQREWKTGRHF